MHHPRTWPANDLQQHKVIGGHTYIYADWGQFCARRKAFFSAAPKVVPFNPIEFLLNGQGPWKRSGMEPLMPCTLPALNRRRSMFC